MSVLEMGNRIWAEPGETAREIGLSLSAMGRHSTEYVNDDGETVVTIEMRGGATVTATYVDQEFNAQPLHAELAINVGEHTYPIGTHIGGCADLTARLFEVSSPENARRQMVSIGSHEGFSGLKTTAGAR